MRLVGVNGIRCYDNPVVPMIGEELTKFVPISEFRNTEISGMNFYEVPAFLRYRDSLVDEFDDGQETLLLGHSLGGVIACAVARRMRKSKVTGIITVNSPHSYCGYTTLLGARGELPAPIVTFQGTRDWVVMWGTKHRKTIQHSVLPVDHFQDIANSWGFARQIAKAASAALFPK